MNGKTRESEKLEGELQGKQVTSAKYRIIDFDKILRGRIWIIAMEHVKYSPDSNNDDDENDDDENDDDDSNYDDSNYDDDDSNYDDNDDSDGDSDDDNDNNDSDDDN